MQSTGPEMVAPVFGIIFLFAVIFISLAATILTIVIYCKIFSKAGFSWALGLLMLVPIANIIMPFILAFSDWPVHKELRLLRQQQNTQAKPM